MSESKMETCSECGNTMIVSDNGPVPETDKTIPMKEIEYRCDSCPLHWFAHIPITPLPPIYFRDGKFTYEKDEKFRG